MKVVVEGTMDPVENSYVSVSVSGIVDVDVEQLYESLSSSLDFDAEMKHRQNLNVSEAWLKERNLLCSTCSKSAKGSFGPGRPLALFAPPLLPPLPPRPPPPRPDLRSLKLDMWNDYVEHM